MNQTINIVDCTLREGDQSPGVYFDIEDKIQLFDALDSAGVSIVDAGMPAIGEGEQRLLKALSNKARDAEVAASVRVKTEEIDLATRCGVDAVFLIFPISALHKKRLGVTDAQWSELGARILEHSHKMGVKPLLVLEDASRGSAEELSAAMSLARNGGANLVMLCDTVGILTPTRAASLFKLAREVGGGDLPLGTHFHNDFGMATANTIAAIEAGATHPSVTLNGLGERAGNAPLAEVVMCLHSLLNLDSGLKLKSLPHLANLAQSLSGVPIAPMAPIVGRRAFLHESGIHVDGILKNPSTYESIDPALLGLSRRLIFGKHTGRASLRYLARQHRLPEDTNTIDSVFFALKELSQQHSKYQVQRVLNRWVNAQEDIGVPEHDVVALFLALGRAAS